MHILGYPSEVKFTIYQFLWAKYLSQVFLQPRPKLQKLPPLMPNATNTKPGEWEREKGAPKVPSTWVQLLKRKHHQFDVSCLCLKKSSLTTSWGYIRSPNNHRLVKAQMLRQRFRL
jgi:hypothetical protein